MTTPPLPSWAIQKAPAGPPAPDSPLDRQLAAFIGPRWPTYRRKFGPFYAEPTFQPTWNWAAALLAPFGFWFLYRKLYLPFILFNLTPGLAFRVLWGDESPLRTVPNPFSPNAPPLVTLTPDAALVMFGIILSTVILAGGTANFLLFRRAMTAIRVVAPAGRDAEGGLLLLRRVGGVSWRAVLVGFAVLLFIQLLSAGSAAGG